MGNPKDVVHEGYQREKANGDPWFTCEHEWKWPLDDISEHAVYCAKCGVPGEVIGKPNDYSSASREIEDGVFWPAT